MTYIDINKKCEKTQTCNPECAMRHGCVPEHEYEDKSSELWYIIDEKSSIIEHFEEMSKEELINYIKSHLSYDKEFFEDFHRNIWQIEIENLFY